MRSTCALSSVALASLITSGIACNKDKPVAPPEPAPVAAKAAAEGVATGEPAKPAARAAKPAREPLRLEVESSDPKDEFGQEIREIKRVLRFDDANGENRVELLIAADPPYPYGEGPVSRRLELIHYATKDGVEREVRAVRDAVPSCKNEGTLWVPHEPGLTDLDGDGIGELSIGYQIGCRRTVKPNEVKAMLLEDGKKYVYRGTTHIAYEEGEEGGQVRDREPAGMPAAFAKALDELWGHVSFDGSLTGEGDGSYSKKDSL